MRSLSFVTCLVYQLFALTISVDGFSPHPARFERSFGLQSTSQPQRLRTTSNSFQQQPALCASSLSSSDTAEVGRYQITFEYCTGCKWGLRSFWLAQELLMTFEDNVGLAAVSLLPSRAKPGGVFRIMCRSANEEVLLWDRTDNGGFPKAKELKQLVRDKVSPALFLGHSDTDARKEKAEASDRNEVEPQSKAGATADDGSIQPEALYHIVEPSVVITYCKACWWLLRAAYFGQELMSTFGDEINSLTLVPSRPPEKAGIFAISLNGDIIWDRESEGDFPEVPELKQRARDLLDPDKDLGHSDNKPAAEVVDDLDDDQAEDARKFFGVL